MRKSAVRRKPKTKLGQFSRSYNHAAHALGVVAIVVVALAIVYRLLIIFRVQHPLLDWLTAIDPPVELAAPLLDVPTYSQYVAIAREKGWTPADPVEKLAITIENYAKIFDSAKTKKSDVNKYLNLLNQELTFLLSVLKASADERPIDLTQTLHHAISAAQKCVYSTIKHRISSSDAKVATRAVVAQMAGHWIFGPARELLKLTMDGTQLQQISTGTQLKHKQQQSLEDNSTGERLFPHITVDVNRRLNSMQLSSSDSAASLGREDGYNALMLVVQYRLYGLIAVLIAIGSDSLVDAMRIAVINGDDLALGLLLSSSASFIVDGSVPEYLMASFDNVLLSSSVEITPFECDMSHVAYCHLLQQAYELQHFQMFKRLVIAYRLQYLTQIQSLDANIPTSDVYTGLLKVYQQLEIFNEYLPSKDVAVEQLGTTRNKVNSLTILPDNYCTSNENSCSSSEDSSLDLSIATGLSSKSTLDGNGQINVRTRQCLIDRVSFSDLTVDQFHNKYVKKNLPVVLYDNNTQSKSNWELQQLVERCGSATVRLGKIPYAQLFGQKERTVSFSDYINGPKGMRAFSSKLAKSIRDGTLYSERLHGGRILLRLKGLASITSSTKQDSSDAGWIPDYVFSGQEEPLTDCLRNEIWSILNASYDSNRNELPKKEISSLFQGGKTKSGINAIKNYIGAVDEQYSQTFSGSDSDTIVKNISSVWNPETWKLQVFVGPPLSGAPFHHHAPAFNFLFLGIKHWTILPPGRDIYTALHPLQWEKKGMWSAKEFPYKGDRYTANVKSPHLHDTACELEQGPGEILYIPRHYSHQTVNLAEVAGFAVEVENYKH